ncbi:MAG: hypothetical protein KDA84_25215 [Planctomycetaceae bacterium]|nr:hypothetical protein [Planctomycetaceae bacterium]
MVDGSNDMARKPKKHSDPIDDQLIQDELEHESEEESPSGPSRVARVRSRVFRPSGLFLLAMVLTGWLVGPHLLERLPDLSGRPEYNLKAENIHLKDRPHWIPHDLIPQVAKLENWDREPISLLEESCCEQIATAFSRHPWIKQVDRVRLCPGARVEMEITFRKPVAMVEAGSGKYYPVDADAILLPPSDFSRADVNRYPIIINPSTPPQGPAGSYWGDLMVLGAARLAEHLGHAHDEQSSHWDHLNLAAISLPRRTTAELKIEEIHYQVLTRDGSRIVWGRAPGTDHPGELTAEQKIGRLTQYLADFGTFRPPQGPLEIDIRHWQEITQRRLSALESPSRH